MYTGGAVETMHEVRSVCILKFIQKYIALDVSLLTHEIDVHWNGYIIFCLSILHSRHFICSFFALFGTFKVAITIKLKRDLNPYIHYLTNPFIICKCEVANRVLCAYRGL